MSSRSSANSISRRAVRPFLRNAILRLKTAHPLDTFTSAELVQNSHGIVKGKLQLTLAQAPSIYYFLSQRCGIGFKEAEALVAARRLVFGSQMEPVVGTDQLRMQMPYEAVQDLDLKIIMKNKKVNNATEEGSHEQQQQQGVEEGNEAVSVLDRSRHRTYLATYLRHGYGKTSNDPAEPRSFVYSLPREVQRQLREAESPANILTPCGYRDISMSGLCIATTDLAMMRFLERRDGGNFGIYRVWFSRGVPDEEIEGVAAAINELTQSDSDPILDDDVKAQVPQFALPCNEGGLFISSRMMGPKKAAADAALGGLLPMPGLVDSQCRLAKSMWVCTPFFRRSWIRDLFLMGTRTSAIELVQIGDVIRFQHPELFHCAGGNHHAALQQALDSEQKNWQQLDAALAKSTSKKQKRALAGVCVTTPSVLGSDMNHFSVNFRDRDPENAQEAKAMKQAASTAWVSPLSKPALDKLFELEHRVKVNTVVRSLRDAQEL